MRSTIMRRWDGSLTLKLGLAVLTVMLGDFVSWQLKHHGTLLTGLPL